MRLAVPGALPAIHAKAPLVTSSRALAGIAYQQFANEQLAAGGESWERPEIYTFEAWLTSIWQEARYSKSDLPALLSPAQEHFLWQQIISVRVPDLFDAGSIARLAAQAANVVVEHSIPLDHEAWTEQQDAEQFHAWFTEFRALCEQNGWMARREILRCLKPRSQPYFIGFDAAPASGQLLSTQATGRPPRVGLKQVESFADELELAARWARARFEVAPRESAAVFVPGLRTHAAAVERVFRSVFYPGRALDVDTQSLESVFHIHAPRPLLEHPLIASALLLLDLARPRITQANATAILRSPFLAGASEERTARAQADLDLRRTRELDISLYDLEKHSRECPRLKEVWKRVRSVVERRKSSNDFPRWARFFADLLHAAGWPGDWELSAEEQRIVEMWKDALSTLSALGLVAPAVDFAVATGAIEGVCLRSAARKWAIGSRRYRSSTRQTRQALFLMPPF